MKSLNKIIMGWLVLTLLMINVPALAREFEPDDDRAQRNALGGAPLASFEDSLRDFRTARENFLKTKITPAQSASPAPAPRPLEIQAPFRFEVPTIIGPHVLPSLEPERVRLLEKMTETLIEYHNDIRKQITTKKVYEETAPALVPKITDNITRLENIKRGLSGVRTLEETQRITETIKLGRQSEIQAGFKEAIVLPQLEKFETRVLNAAQIRQAETLRKINAFEQAGKDVGSLKRLLNKADAKIDAARVKLAEIKSDVHKPNLKSDLETIQNQIKDAYQLFRDIAILGSSL